MSKIKFTIDDRTYHVPDYINIESYVKIFKYKNLFDEDYFAAKILNITTGVPVDDINKSDYQQVEYLAAYVLSLIPSDKPEFKDRFELDGVHYGFFPNWQDITFAEFVDMDTISTKSVDELLDLLHILSAIMYRPIVSQISEHDFQIEKYDVESMKKRAELFKKKLDVRYVLGAQSFFTKFANKFLGYTQLSSIQTLTRWTKIKLVWRMRKMMWAQIFKKRSGGSLSSTELLTMILQSTSTSIKRK